MDKDLPAKKHLKIAMVIDYWVEHPAELKEAGQRYHSYSQSYRIESSYEKLVDIYSESVITPAKHKV